MVRHRRTDCSQPAIIFDLDGTLADTLADITYAVNVALSAFDRPSVTPTQMRGWIGEGLGVLLARASGLMDQDVVSAMVDRYRPVYRACMLERTALYSGVADMLDVLDRADTGMCVLSNKPHEFTEPICRALLSHWRFRTCLGHRLESARKPDPAVALRLIEQMGADPSNTVLVGDSTIDIQTAQNAGMKSVAVTWGFGQPAELAGAKPSAIIHQPADLLDWLAGDPSAPQAQ